VPDYIPRKGDFVVLTFDPQAGHEQKGRRPALIVSNDLFNRHTGMAFACPITHTNRRFPFHISLGEGLPVAGFVMVDQVKSTDFRARSAKYVGRASDQVLNEVLAVLDTCIF
jgi:mRNA interferase MazF